MLKKIICDVFVEKEVEFHDGLNVIVGDDVASNSIGKSTMLMIIDFVFGGDDYITKNSDTVEQLGHHSFKYVFVFNDKEYFFSRNTKNYKYVDICNEKFETKNKISSKEYTKWLKEKYQCELEDLSFRDIIGRYFRIYGKENLNEKKPIQYFEKEIASKSVSALLKLFDKYKVLKAYEEQTEKMLGDKKALINAAQRNFVPNINTRKLFKNNEKRISELSVQLDEIKKEIALSTIDLQSIISKDIMKLKREKSRLNIQGEIYRNRLIRTNTNLKKGSVNIYPELEQFKHYFPGFNENKIVEIEAFHQKISNILKDELENAEKELRELLADIEFQIQKIDKEIEKKLSIDNAPKYAIENVIEISTQIQQLKAENGYYQKKKELEESIKQCKKELEELKERALDDICNQINIRMHELNKVIYEDGRRAPNFNIHNNKYSFNTVGDTGTGTAYANMISFDLAVLELTKLPALAHDLPLLKNIENSALENIISLYCESEKQIFIALDKMSSYGKKANDIVENHKVLQLSKNKLLFVKNWKRQADN